MTSLTPGQRRHRPRSCALHLALPAALRRVRCSFDALACAHARASIAGIACTQDDIDLVVPRGGNKLVSYIQSHTAIPVLGHADGICHVYVDEKVDLDEAVRICVDAKVRGCSLKLIDHLAHLRDSNITCSEICDNRALLERRAA